MPTRVDEVMAELAALSDDKVRAANAKRGDVSAINLGDLRKVAKRLKTDHELAIALWKTGDQDARLLGTLIGKPKAFQVDELDAMVREIGTTKLLDWFVNLVKASPHAEALRLRWKDAPRELVARAGWSLTTSRVVKDPAGLDLPGLLDQIEAGMKAAPAPKQWSMNHCLAEIGIHNADLRARAISIGERLQVLVDYPTPKGCTSPYAPIWIAELVRRSEASRA